LVQSDLTSNNFHFFKNDQINAVGLDCRNKYQSAKKYHTFKDSIWTKNSFALY